MNTEEEEWTLATARERIAELEERLECLEAQVGRQHSCAVDLCEWDDNGDCILSACYEPHDDDDEPELWGASTQPAYPWADQ